MTLRRTPYAVAGGLVAAGLALSACSGDPAAAAHTGTPKLKVTGAFMPQPVGDLAAGFLVVHNTGTGPDKLVSVTSTLSSSISIHQTVKQRMVEVTSFPIPAGGSLDLERGGNHIMLMDIKHPVKQGQLIALELHFQKSAPIKVTVPVKATNFQPDQTS